MGKSTRRYRSLHAYRHDKQRWGKTLSQAEVAAKLQVTPSAWSRIETGQRIPKPALAKALHELTGVPLETLLGFDR
jgi:transcriptional regulator with XRE-family HTH domain